MTGVRALASAAAAAVLGAAVACGSLEAQDDAPAEAEGGGAGDAGTDASVTGSAACPTLFDEPFALGFTPAREPWDEDDVDGTPTAQAATDAPSLPSVLVTSAAGGGASAIHARLGDLGDRYCFSVRFRAKVVSNGAARLLLPAFLADGPERTIAVGAVVEGGELRLAVDDPACVVGCAAVSTSQPVTLGEWMDVRLAIEATPERIDAQLSVQRPDATPVARLALSEAHNRLLRQASHRLRVGVRGGPAVVHFDDVTVAHASR